MDGKASDAVECYVKAQTLAPRFAEAWKKEAMTLKKFGKADGARAAAKMYLELVPTDTEIKEMGF